MTWLDHINSSILIIKIFSNLVNTYIFVNNLINAIQTYKMAVILVLNLRM